MPTLLINGCNIRYEVIGTGEPLVLTAGGRQSGVDSQRIMAERLARSGRYQVIIYDRRNCGASDVIITGDRLECEIWADDLAALLRQLDAAPAWVGGGSAGCLVSLRLAVQYPELVKGLLLWSVSGGPLASELVAEIRCNPFIRAAEQEGMAGVLRTPFFTERVAENPSNRARLLAMEPQDFIGVMRTWRREFSADRVVHGVADDELRAIHLPTVIVPGNDDIHPLWVAEHLHRLWPHATFQAYPWSPEEAQALQSLPQKEQLEERARRIAPLLVDFLAAVDQAALP